MISFCLPYTDSRKHHLDMTYPENKVLCDEYGCELLIYHWTEKWNGPMAWNTVHSMARGDIQVAYGADIYITREYIEDLIEKFNENMNIVITGSNGGRIAVSAENFKKLGGFDETLVGWGWEDIDFIYRAQNLGLTCHLSVGTDFIPHPDTLRFPPGNKNQYRYANWNIMRYNYDNKIIDWRDK